VKRPALLLCTLGMAALLAACGEKPQQGTSTGSHTEAWKGSDHPAFNAPGWKASDQTAWDNQLRSRAQNQNEYSRVGQ
jgi:transcription elongation factor